MNQQRKCAGAKQLTAPCCSHLNVSRADRKTSSYRRSVSAFSSHCLILTALCQLSFPGSAQFINEPYTLQQQRSPLLGQGRPSNATKDRGVYVSLWVVRLLEVQDNTYTFDAIMEFVITWVDEDAPRIVFYDYNGTPVYLCSQPQATLDQEDQDNCTEFDKLCTQLNFQQLNTSDPAVVQDPLLVNKCQRYLAVCSRPCANHMAQAALCCDRMYLPDFTFPNNYAVGRNSYLSHEIFVQENGLMVWTARVQASFFTPLVYGSYPLDSQQLIVRVQYNEPSTDHLQVSSTAIAKQNIVRQTSEGGYKQSGDDLAEWILVNFTGVKVNYKFSPAVFQTLHVSPNNTDPVLQQSPGGFKISQSMNSNGILSFTEIIYVISIQRIVIWHVLNMLMPIVACGCLGCLVFFLHVRRYQQRLR